MGNKNSGPKYASKKPWTQTRCFDLVEREFDKTKARTERRFRDRNPNSDRNKRLSELPLDYKGQGGSLDIDKIEIFINNVINTKTARYGGLWLSTLEKRGFSTLLQGVGCELARRCRNAIGAHSQFITPHITGLCHTQQVYDIISSALNRTKAEITHQNFVKKNTNIAFSHMRKEIKRNVFNAYKESIKLILTKVISKIATRDVHALTTLRQQEFTIERITDLYEKLFPGSNECSYLTLITGNKLQAQDLTILMDIKNSIVKWKRDGVSNEGLERYISDYTDSDYLKGIQFATCSDLPCTAAKFHQPSALIGNHQNTVTNNEGALNSNSIPFFAFGVV